METTDIGDEFEQWIDRSDDQESDDEVIELRRVKRVNVFCRWNMHSYILVDPIDEEFEELCSLLGRSRSNLSFSKDLMDRICYRCGHIDANLQRFLASLRRLRSHSKSKPK